MKLEVPPRALARIKRLRSLGCNGHAQEKDLVSVYFDTARHKLRKKGLSLRVRHIGEKRIQTIKANGACAAGLFKRAEWEKPIKRDTPDLRAVRRTALGRLVRKKLEHALKPVFETRVRRTVLPLVRGKSHIDVTLDQGQVRHGRQAAPISEVELELKRGRPSDLFDVARKLTGRIPARIAVRSKADRGYDLVDSRPVAAVWAQKIGLDPEMSTQQAFQAVTLACLHHIAANEPAVVARDSEGVHQMRVGLRRLRAAIAVFSDLVDDDETARIKAELKWLTGELGPARDLDVYVTGNIKPLRRTLSRPRALDALQNDIELQRARAFGRAKKAVESPRYRSLMFDALGWIEGGQWTANRDHMTAALRERNAADFARDELARRVEKVMKRAHKLAKLDPQRRHKLRIAAKKLRYAVDFFAALFEGRKAQRRLRRFARELKRLQNCLGALNDIAVHQRLAGKFVPARGQRRQRAFAIGVISAREQARTGPLREAAERAADRFVEARPFWT